MSEAQQVVRKERPESSPPLRAGEKYDRILQSAIDIIAEKGFAHARISDIASRAGVADGTVYLYFRNKDEILHAALDRAFGRFSASVSAALAEESGPMEQLAVVARLHLEGLTASRSLAILVQNETRQSHKFLSEFAHQPFVNYINVVRDIIRRGQAQGLLRPELSDRVAALCLFGALDELISSWLYTGKQMDPQQSSTQVVDLLLHGMSSTPRHG